MFALFPEDLIQLLSFIRFLQQEILDSFLSVEVTC